MLLAAAFPALKLKWNNCLCGEAIFWIIPVLKCFSPSCSIHTQSGRKGKYN